MASLRPRLAIGDCLFTHMEPWRELEKIEHLWQANGDFDPPARTDASFAAAPHRFLFVGHHHRWRIVTPIRCLLWRGQGPVRLGAERALIYVAAVADGWCGVFDTGTFEITPSRLRDP